MHFFQADTSHTGWMLNSTLPFQSFDTSGNILASDMCSFFPPQFQGQQLFPRRLSQALSLRPLNQFCLRQHTAFQGSPRPVMQVLYQRHSPQASPQVSQVHQHGIPVAAQPAPRSLSAPQTRLNMLFISSQLFREFTKCFGYSLNKPVFPPQNRIMVLFCGAKVCQPLFQNETMSLSKLKLSPLIKLCRGFCWQVGDLFPRVEGISKAQNFFFGFLTTLFNNNFSLGVR